jgi:hypothetical protein
MWWFMGQMPDKTSAQNEQIKNKISLGGIGSVSWAPRAGSQAWRVRETTEERPSRMFEELRIVDCSSHLAVDGCGFRHLS